MSNSLIRIIEAACMPQNGYSDVDPDEWKRLRHLSRRVRDALGSVAKFQIRDCKFQSGPVINGLAHIPDYLIDSVCIPDSYRYGTIDTKSSKGANKHNPEEISRRSIVLKADMLTTLMDDNDYTQIGYIIECNRYMNDRLFLQFTELQDSWRAYSHNRNLHLSFMLYYETSSWDWQMAFTVCIIDVIPDNIAMYEHAANLLSNPRITPNQYVRVYGLLLVAKVAIPSDRVVVYEAIREITRIINPEVFAHILCDASQVQYYADILQSKCIRLADATKNELEVIHRMLDKDNYTWIRDKYLGKPRLLKSKAALKLETFARFNRNFTAKEKIEIFHMTGENLMDLCKDPTMTPQLLIETFGLGSPGYTKARRIRLENRSLFDV